MDFVIWNDWLCILFSGGLFLLVGIWKLFFYKSDVFVYGVVVVIGYMVLFYGMSNKMRYSDILIGIVMMLFLGLLNMLYVVMIIWIVNVLELLYEK